MLVGDRICLFPLAKEDLKFVHQLNNNFAIMSYWFEEPYESYMEIEDLHITHIHDQSEGRFILKDKADNKVGLVELTEINFIHRRCEFGIIISSGQEGKGYATEATQLVVEYSFNVLNLHKIYLLVDDDNEAALHIYRKYGFLEEEKLIDEFYINGSYRTAIRMYIRKD